MNERNEIQMAGVIDARCECCEAPQDLVPHRDLGATQLVCPQSRTTYLDRGDGWFEPDGSSLDGGTVIDARAPEVLSDRPTRTGPKTRIDLERATFAGGR